MKSIVPSLLTRRCFSSKTVSNNASDKAPYLQMISQIWLRTSGCIQTHDPPKFGPLKIKANDEDHIQIVNHIVKQLGLSGDFHWEMKDPEHLEIMKLFLLNHFLDYWTNTEDICYPKCL